MKFTATELARVLKGTVDGNPHATATSFAKIESGKEGQLCFFANPKYEQYVYTTTASILLVNKDFEPKQAVTPTMIRVENAYAAIAELLKYVSDQKKSYRRHRGLCSSIAPSARIGKKVYVGDFTHIGRGCKVGDYTKIYENVYVGAGTTIGSKCILYPGVRIYPGMVIGDNVILHANCVIGSDGFGNVPQEDGTWEKIEHLGKVIIGDNVEIGANTTVDRAEMEATVIGNGVKIDNLCQIAHNVQIGDNTVMAAQCGIAGSTHHRGRHDHLRPGGRHRQHPEERTGRLRLPRHRPGAVPQELCPVQKGGRREINCLINSFFLSLRTNFCND